MKNAVIHSVPLIISMIWLNTEKHTLNPVMLKGPDFLKFYLILLSGTYLVALLLRRSTGSFSGISLYGFFFVLILGLVKLVRGIILGKPVGFLVMIIILEVIVLLFVNCRYVNRKMKG